MQDTERKFPKAPIDLSGYITLSGVYHGELWEPNIVAYPEPNPCEVYRAIAVELESKSSTLGVAHHQYRSNSSSSPVSRYRFPIHNVRKIYYDEDDI